MRSSLRLLPLLQILVLASVSFAATRVPPIPVPEEMRSTQFTVEVNGKPVDVAHAAASYDFVSIDDTGPVDIAVTAAEAGFWDHGVDIQPWRLGIRPERDGRTIRFRLREPAKLSIAQPGDFLNHAKMLFLFFARPPAAPPKSLVTQSSYHFLGPGVHHQSLNPKNGETWYLAPGAVIFGSLNLFGVENVTVFGRGTIVYDGPQNPENDDGWTQKPDWHCIGAKNAHHVRIDGVTCVIRSRTWSIQMKDSTNFEYNDLRVIGGNPGNANQDGMDWLGGGDAVVRDSFFRASDDVFAMQGNWDGYEHDALVAPGHDISNILVEHSVLSTSISNIVRAGWPEKTYNSSNFTLRDSDILHGGIGSCGPPFALFTFWGAKGAKGAHTGFTFENLWLDDWYSLFQMEKEEPELNGFTFHNIWALGQPPLASSELIGRVKGVRLENVKYGQTVVSSNAEVPVDVSSGADQPVYAAGDKQVQAAFHVSPEILEPGVEAIFTAEPAADTHAKYTWLFGDGTTAQGKQVRHRFRDALGTELDGNGSGSFRVLLRVENRAGAQDWATQQIVVVSQWHDPAAKASTLAGLDYHIYPGSWPELPAFSTETPTLGGVTVNLNAVNAGGFTRFAVAYDGLLEIPRDGGYTFRLLDRDGARLVLDGQTVAKTGPPFAEVCGSPVNAIRYASGTIGLRAGKHTLHIEALESVSPEAPRLLWEGPGVTLADVPPGAWSRSNETTIGPRPNTPISTVGP